MNEEHKFAQFLLRSWPFPRGAGRLTDKFFRKLHFRSEIATVETTDGFPMTVMPNDLVGRHIYLTGEFDRSNVEVLCAFAEPGDTLLDIGCNIGYVSGCFLHNVPNSKVVAVEPQQDVRELLARNLDHFGDRAVIFPFAISDQDGEAFFKVNTENRGAGALSQSGIRIQTRSGNSLFSEILLTSVDLVKIDVEGHEETVISSCNSWFAKLQPKIVLFEDLGTKAAGSIGEMLHRSGYDVYSIVKYLTRLKLKRVLSAADCQSTDYLAISRNRRQPEGALLLF